MIIFSQESLTLIQLDKYFYFNTTYISPHNFLTKSYDAPMALAAFLKKSNAVGSMPSEEIIKVLLSYIG